MSTIDFSGRVALVSGGARGIGRATMARFAALGATVYGADWKADALGRTVESVRREAGSKRIHGLVADVRKEEEVAAGVARVVGECGRLDIVVNNAGVNTRSGSCIRMEERTLDFTLAVNLKGAFFFCKHAIPAMLERDGGSIVNLSSVAAATAGMGCAAYAVSKAAVEALSREIAVEFGGRGIRCTALAPGIVRTEGTLGAAADAAAAEQRLLSRAGAIARPGEADEIAALICFLASPAAAIVNGATISADGGYRIMAHDSTLHGLRPAAQEG